MSASTIGAPQCNPPVSTACESTAEMLIRYASFATAGLPTGDVEHAIEILTRQPNDSAASKSSAVGRPPVDAGKLDAGMTEVDADHETEQVDFEAFVYSAD
jgi:hypothetical protein